MTKIRKVKLRKKYRMNVNRKRLRNKQFKLPTITCPQIKESWDAVKSTRTNLNQMGLAYEPNDALQIPNSKKEQVEKVLKQKDDNVDEKLQTEEENVEITPIKVHVAQQLEAEAKAPRKRKFMLPNGQVYFLTYLMDKYGENYKAMALDKKNYYQYTWKQIRAKIKVFKGIPEQYNKYLENKDKSSIN